MGIFLMNKQTQVFPSCKFVVPCEPQRAYIVWALTSQLWVGFSYVSGASITLSREFTTLKLFRSRQIKVQTCRTYLSVVHLLTYPCGTYLSILNFYPGWTYLSIWTLLNHVELYLSMTNSLHVHIMNIWYTSTFSLERGYLKFGAIIIKV